MKTIQLSIVTLMLVSSTFAKADFFPGDELSYLNKSFLLCLNKDANVELTAELTQDLKQPSNGFYDTAGMASYNFSGKQYFGAKYQKQDMALRYGSQGSLNLSHHQIPGGFSPFVLDVSYKVYGPYYSPNETFVYKGLIKTPTGPRLVGEEIEVYCKILSADSFFNPNYRNTEF